MVISLILEGGFDDPAATSRSGARVRSTSRGEPGRWQFLGEVERKRGLAARAARTQAILDATNGKAREGDVYADVLRSEWRVAMDWAGPPAR